jgi:hypothetical protein
MQFATTELATTELATMENALKTIGAASGRLCR